MKGLVAFFALLGTSGFIKVYHTTVKPSEHARERHKKQPPARIHLFAMIAAALLFVLCCAAAIQFDLPGTLQRTNPDIIRTKEMAREVCRNALQQDDYIAAETAMRNNTLSKELFAAYKERSRGSIDRVLRKVNNVVLFGFGTAFSVVPGVFAMILVFGTIEGHFFKLIPEPKPRERIDEATKEDNDKDTTEGTKESEQNGPKKSSLREQKNEVRSELIQTVMDWLSPDKLTSWDIVHLTTSMGMNMSWVAFLAFYLWLEERQVTGCMLASGHWYTFICTCFAMWMNWVAMMCYNLYDRPDRSHAKLASAYATFACGYVAFSLRVLINSQMFHHDAIESRAGIAAAAYITPLMTMAAITAMYFANMPINYDIPETIMGGVTATSKTPKLGADSETSSEVNHSTSTFTRGAAPPPPVSTLQSETATHASATRVNEESSPNEKSDTKQQRPGFLDQIAKGSEKLRKTSIESVKQTAPPAAAEAESLGSMLMSAIRKRRVTIEGSNDTNHSSAMEGEGNSVNEVQENEWD